MWAAIRWIHMAPFGIDMIESKGQWTLSQSWRIICWAQLYLGMKGLVESFGIRFKTRVKVDPALYQPSTHFKVCDGMIWRGEERNQGMHTRSSAFHMKRCDMCPSTLR